MPAGSSLADIAQKSVVLLLAGSTGLCLSSLCLLFAENHNTYARTALTVYYVVNIGVMVNRRMELKKQGKLEEELVRL
jgi:hypothetical protein